MLQNNQDFDLITFIGQTYDMDISDQPWAADLAEASVMRTYQPGQLITDIGDPNTDLQLLVSGAVRCFFLDYEGVVFTDCFLADKGYPLNSPCIDRSSECGLEALTVVTAACIPTELLLPLLMREPGVMALQNRMLDRALFFHWEQKVSRFRLSAMQRYLKFMRDYPGLDGRINSRYIADYIGIAPESLSRLRKMLRDNDNEDEIFVPEEVLLRQKLSSD